MAEQQEKKHLPYKDNPAVQEVFADSLELLSFNGQYAQLTLTVNRLEETKVGEQQKGSRATAARIVMSPELLTTLYNKLSQLVGAMEEKGIVTRGKPNLPEKPESPSEIQ